MHGLLERGVAIAPGPYEVMFPSLAHTDADMERTVEVFGEAARRAVPSPP
jgi:glutamate-1-semialdehyde 2,1-aminomutase